MMEETLETDVSAKASTQSMFIGLLVYWFIGLFSALVVLITTIISYVT